MDKRNKEWPDKNDKEAHDEGTNVQGAASGPDTRTSAQNASAKGKEPGASQTVAISEDEFELVIGPLE